MKLWALAVCSLISVGEASAAPSTVLANLPNTGVNAVRVDAAGNIYIAGFQGTASASDTWDAFVAKLSPDGSKVLYSTRFAGAKSDYAVALEIDSSGGAYILGQTLSPDFPTTQGALQTTSPESSTQAFVAKLDAQGKVVYATLIGGDSVVHPSSGGLVLDSIGEVFVSGQTIGGSFPATTGAPYTSTEMNTFFVLKLDAGGGKILAAVRGVGGRLALDDQGSVYVAGLQFSTPTSIPITGGAFQSTYSLHACSGSAQLAFGCSYQYVTKLNASLSQIVYSTYLTGSWGATPAAISIDAQRNVLLAGTTNSPDYPTTPSAIEPYYVANAPAPPQTCLFSCVFPPPASGYVTKLNSTGTGLVYSTFFSGTQTDTIGFAAFTSDGIYLAGQAGSADLPGFEGVPQACFPENFATRLTPDGLAVSRAGVLTGNALAFDPTTGTLLVWTGSNLVRFDPATPPSSVACILDAADLKPVTAIAPGELLSIFGANFTNGGSQSAGVFVPSLGGVTVRFDGVPGPMLYVSPQQINVQAPYEIANGKQVTLNLASSETKAFDSRIISVVARNPVAFLDTSIARSSITLANCSLGGQLYSGGPLPLAFNDDGSRNTCVNPARAGSIVRIFLAGLGIASPAAVTGSINTVNQPLNLPITFVGTQATVVSAIALPGSISGTWQVDLRLPVDLGGAITISPSVDSVPVRDTNLTIWTR